MLQNYLLIAWRNLLKNKVYSFINIFGLSIGLACAMLIILYVKDEVSYDRFHTNGPNLYRIVSESVDKKNPSDIGRNSNTGNFQGPRFTAQRWLEGYPYRITVGWSLFAGGASLVVSIALFTVSFQAIRAALASPVKSLRSE